ncbi:lipoprotein [Spiroplasma sp. SV19]|uniref:lipoprotein n=1 Tax=Spiroplasma sp. SV19 TaxID=2570468 RepID=UPI0024B834C6|nr:lipoprotein [Spiroplasma sp. SV19]WHQ36472.1 hypothetical protein E7Y35_00760 [Spiroplasma sp. SV19]
MKKILALLGAVSLVGTSAVSVVACNHPPTGEKGSVDDIKKQLEQYTDTPFFASSSQITNDKLASELASRMTMGSYKLVVKNDATFVQPKITDGNALQAQTLKDFKQQLISTTVQGELVVNSGSAVVSLLKKDSELFSVKIKWSSNELLFLASTVNKINNVGDTTQNIKFPLPPLIPGVNLTLADLYSFLSIINLPKELINSIDLTQIDSPDFVTKFDQVLQKISEPLEPIVGGDFLAIKIPLDFKLTDGINLKGYNGKMQEKEGTVSDLLHNIAPDLIALLQWYLKEGQQKIETTHNTVLPLIQYLLSPVNSNVKENIRTEFGDDGWFYKTTATNFDSLIFHLLAGYKGKPTTDDSRFVFKIVGKYLIPLDEVFDQDLIGDKGHKLILKLELNPTLLIASMLDIFSKNNGQGIDAVGESILQPKTWLGMSSFVQGLIPNINVYLGPSIMSFGGSFILQNLGLSSTEIENNNITMSAGTVKLQFKNKNNQWENFKVLLKEVDKTDKNGKPVTDDEGNPVKVKVGPPDLTQILGATDLKISFMNVKFKVTPKK